MTNQLLCWNWRNLLLKWRKLSQKITIVSLPSSRRDKKILKVSPILILPTSPLKICIKLNFNWQNHQKKMLFTLWKLRIWSLLPRKKYPKLKLTSKVIQISLWMWLEKLSLRRWSFIITFQSWSKKELSFPLKNWKFLSKRRQKENFTEIKPTIEQIRLKIPISRRWRMLNLSSSTHQNWNIWNHHQGRSWKYTNPWTNFWEKRTCWLWTSHKSNPSGDIYMQALCFVISKRSTNILGLSIEESHMILKQKLVILWHSSLSCQLRQQNRRLLSLQRRELANSSICLSFKFLRVFLSRSTLFLPKKRKFFLNPSLNSRWKISKKKPSKVTNSKYINSFRFQPRSNCQWSDPTW